MPEDLAAKAKEKVQESVPGEKKGGGKSCFKIFLIIAAVLFLLLLLVAGAAAWGLAAIGLVEVPVISRLIKFPPPPIDFSYQPVSQAQLESKLETLEDAAGKINLSLTDGEANSLLPQLLGETEGSAVKDLRLKFTENTVHVKGTLAQNDAPFYVALRLAKPVRGSLEIGIKEVRLGALSLPAVVVEGLAQRLLGIEDLSKLDLPADVITISEGKIVVTGLDLSGLKGGE